MLDGTEDRALTSAFGDYLKCLRLGLNMSLREVEKYTENEISNAYLSQLENGKIAKPSPKILYSLANVYSVSYGNLMERVGYVSPSRKRVYGTKHGRAATFSIDNLNMAEERELLKYLTYLRSQRQKDNF